MTVSNSHFAFLVDKSYVVGRVEELLLSDSSATSTALTVDTTVFQDGGLAFKAAAPLEVVIQDLSGTGGTAHAEVITISAVGTLGATCVLTCSALENSYTAANGASILTPGFEMKLTSADFNCRLRGISLTPKIDEDDSGSKYATGDHDEDESISGMRSGEISFSEKISIASQGIATTPYWAKFLRGMGAQVQLYGSTGLEFLPLASADNITMTLWYVYKENAALPRATAYCFAGCKGTGDLGAAGIGKPYILNGKFSGKWTRTSDLTNAQILVLTSPETKLPEKMLSNSVATNFGSVGALYISQFKLDFGNEVQPLYNQADPTGIDYYSIVTRKPRLTLDPIMKLKANEDWDSLVSNETTGSIAVSSALTSPNITLTVPNAQLTTPAIAAREGYVNQNRTYRCLRNNGGGVYGYEATWSFLIGSRS